MIYGENPTLLTVNYVKPDKKRGIEESFEVVYKTEDGTVYKSNEPAEAEIYFVKPELRNFDYNITVVDSLWVSLIFTVVSVVRGYVIRRFFNSKEKVNG